MANRPANIRKADAERVLKGVLATGLAVTRVEYEVGKLVIYTSDNEVQESPLDAWRRKNGHG